MSPVVNVAVITMHEGKVLIGRSNKAPDLEKWVIPGGTVQQYEAIPTTGIRNVFEQTGITVEPDSVMFVSEIIKPDNEQHTIIVYLYGKYASGDLKPGADFSEANWVDVRELGQLQADMAEATVDAFYKFSIILRQQAARQGGQAS